MNVKRNLTRLATTGVSLSLVATSAGCPTEQTSDSGPKPTSGIVLGRELSPPEWTPLQITDDTYPFGSDRTANSGVDIAAHDYVEEEYLISGEARVYDAVPDTDYDVKVLGVSEYVTRALVRQPADPDRWSGRVVVEYMNATDNMDLQVFWARAHNQLMESGDAYIGFSGKSNVFPLLRQFDKERYGTLQLPSPEGLDQACGSQAGDPDFDPNVIRGEENGLLWDLWNQVGLSARIGSSPLPGPATQIIATGESQSGIALVNLYRWFGGDRATTDTDVPIFDGYLDEDSVGFIATSTDSSSLLRVGTLSQCADPLPAGDAQASLTGHPDRSVPYLAIHSQWGFWPGSTPSAHFRDWTIAGANHVDRNMYGFIYPIASDLERAGVVGDNQLPWFAGATAEMYSPAAWTCPDVPEAPLAAGVRLGYQELAKWIETRTPPPTTDALEVDEAGVPILDEHGNALGGLRFPAVDVPVASYKGEGWGDCASFIEPFPEEKLRALYGTQDEYERRFSESADALVKTGLLRPDDAAEMIAELDQWQIVQ